MSKVTFETAGDRTWTIRCGGTTIGEIQQRVLCYEVDVAGVQLQVRGTVKDAQREVRKLLK